ncbi:P27 family phage terminase small subunit [Glycomyces harbinensis]|uniref:P27 family phage terminase small subunit n=1 Tax=Glycomyces harbinensis TaxID=58114 RepID=UPI0015A62495
MTRNTYGTAFRVRPPSKGLLASWDVEAFSILCDAVIQYRQASKLVTQAGVLIKTRKDSAVMDPPCRSSAFARRRSGVYAKEFGLTSSARR